MHATKTKKLHSGLIGQRLIEAGYLTRQQSQEALKVQRETMLLLGEVCVLRGWLTWQQLCECLGPVRSRLGNKLLASGKLSMEQLWTAILEQRRSGERLGKILLERGFVDEHTLENV